MEHSLKDVLEIATDVAAEIAIQRQRKGMTQGDLAKKMNVSASVVSKWESGLRDLRLSTLVRIADALDIDVKSLFVPNIVVGDSDVNVFNKHGVIICK